MGFVGDQDRFEIDNTLFNDAPFGVGNRCGEVWEIYARHVWDQRPQLGPDVEEEAGHSDGALFLQLGESIGDFGRIVTNRDKIS